MPPLPAMNKAGSVRRAHANALAAHKPTTGNLEAKPALNVRAAKPLADNAHNRAAGHGTRARVHRLHRAGADVLVPNLGQRVRRAAVRARLHSNATRDARSPTRRTFYVRHRRDSSPRDGHTR